MPPTLPRKRSHVKSELGNTNSTHLPDTFLNVSGVLDGLKHSQVESLGSSQNGLLLVNDIQSERRNASLDNLKRFSSWFSTSINLPNVYVDGAVICADFVSLILPTYKVADFLSATGSKKIKSFDLRHLMFLSRSFRNLMRHFGYKRAQLGFSAQGKVYPISHLIDHLNSGSATMESYIFLDSETLGGETRQSVIDALIDGDGCFTTAAKALKGQKGVLGFTKPYLLESIFLLASYVDMMFMFVPRSKVVRPTKSTLPDLILETMSWGSNFVKFTKYVTVFPMAKFLKNQLPTKPAGFKGSPYYLRGDMKKMIHARLRSVRDLKSGSLYFTILQGVKRACYIVDEGFVATTLRSHLNTMTTPPKPFTWDSWMSILTQPGLDESSRATMDFDFESYAQRLFSRFRLKRDLLTRVVDPSTSASFEAGRQKGGQRGHHYRNYLDSMGINAEVLLSDDMMIMNENGELRYHNIDLEEYNNHTLDIYYNDQPINAAVVPIREPIKVRTITAGEASVYALSKPLQQDMWSFLRLFPQFALIGEELDVRHLNDLYNQTQRLKKPEDFDLWVSGDFAGATDTLDINFTLSAFDIMMQNGLRTDSNYYRYYKVMRKILEPHRLHYDYAQTFGCVDYIVVTMDTTTYPVDVTSNPVFGAFTQFTVKGEFGPVTFDYNRGCALPPGRYRIISFSVLQMNGQLMGSPLSFPLLCAINLICYWMSLEVYLQRTVRLQDLPVRINGDDILFMTSPALYLVWQRCIASVGFKLSLGKNYVSDTWLTVNSMLFRFNPGTDILFTKADFTNLGMLMSQSKGAMFDINKKQSLRENYQKAIFTAQDPYEAHKRFLFWNRKQLDKMTLDGKFNLFVPLRYGGLGFPIHPDIASSIKVTKFQQRFATFLKYKIDKKMSKGEFPSHYIFSTVSTSRMIQSLKIPTGLVYYSYQPSVGPLSLGLYALEQVDPEREFRVQGLNAGEIIPTDDALVYRHPHKSLLREYNKITNVGRQTGLLQNKIGAMPLRQLLYSEKTRLCWSRTPDHSLGEQELQKLEGYHDFGSNQQTAPSSVLDSVQSS